MAENMLQSRIMLKYDTLAHWNSSSLILKKGEVGIAEIPSGTSSSGLTPPAIGIKVGDGESTFSALKWIQAAAGDVYAWAKAATKPTYQASEIQGLSDYISGEIEDTDTKYQVVKGTGTNVNKYYLQSQDKNSTTWTTVSTIDLSSIVSDITALQNKVGNSTVTEQITDAIGDLNATDTAVAKQLVSAVSESNGIITVTRRALVADDIPNLNVSKLNAGTLSVSRGGTGASTLTAGSVLIGNGTNAVTFKAIDTTVTSGSSNLITSGAVESAIADATAGLTGAMHYIGTSTTAITDGGTQNPTIGGNEVTTKNAGDVVLYGSQEFVWNGTAWELFGDEGSYALKTRKVTGTDGLTGGGDLTSDRTISHAVPTGAKAETKGTSGGRTYIQTITTDKFGHITAVATATETVTNTTYTFAEGNTNGAFQVTPSGGTAKTVSIHGLGAAAYKAVGAVAPENTGLVTGNDVSAAIRNGIENLDGTAIATAADGNQYSVLTGVSQVNGEISKTSEVKLAAIAKTGNVNDLQQTAGDVLILDCGSATTVI